MNPITGKVHPNIGKIDLVLQKYGFCMIINFLNFSNDISRVTTAPQINS